MKHKKNLKFVCHVIFDKNKKEVLIYSHPSSPYSHVITTIYFRRLERLYFKVHLTQIAARSSSCFSPSLVVASLSPPFICNDANLRQRSSRNDC